jgi:hypothetical protein
MASRRVRASPLRILFLCCICGGLAGSLLDLDHIPRILGWQLPIPFETLAPDAFNQGRILHGLALVVGGIGSACAGGYLYWMVLKGVANKVWARLRKKSVVESAE